MTVKTYDTERRLEDEYPTYGGYLYIAVYANGDQEVYKHEGHGHTAKETARFIGAMHLKNCDIAVRDLWHRAI